MSHNFAPQIIPATLKDYPTLQNMARFYAYDLSKSCGFLSDHWVCPSDGLFEGFNYKNYFEDPTRQAYLIKVDDELAGFVLLNKVGTIPNIDWKMSEFFILAKFQRKGIGKQVAYHIWQSHPGLWEIAVIPENTGALAFWHNIIASFTKGTYVEEIKVIDYDEHQPKRHILSFDTAHKPAS